MSPQRLVLMVVLLGGFGSGCGPSAAPATVLEEVHDDSAWPADLDAEVNPQDLHDLGQQDYDAFHDAPEFVEEICGPARPCEPLPCQAVECTLDGRCEYEPFPDGTLCDDSNPCTESDQCAQGECSGTTKACATAESCLEGLCNTDSGECEFIPREGGCDDGNLCTVGDWCDSGLCVGSAFDCSDDNSCTFDSCAPATGCTHTAMPGMPCETASLCTVDAVCLDDGSCGGGAPRNCDDENPCTKDTCIPETGECLHEALSQLPCSDGTLCTTDDQCVDGQCLGNPINCDDGNLCTSDSCLPELGCENLFNTLPCDDANPCTENDRCKNGSCAPGALSSCSDGNACTADYCDPETGECQHSFVDWPCDDGSLCTSQDRCVNGMCMGVALDCRDNNPCTSDSCDPAVGCIHTDVPAPCEDGNLCTLGDFCADGTCQSGKGSPSCDDKNPCTSDSCSPASGQCIHQPVGGSCDDGNPCTLGDYCQAGTCQAGTIDWCECSGDLDCAPLDDGNYCNGVLYCDKAEWPYRCRIVPASVVQCDTQYDTQCESMRCNPENGSCTLQPQPDGLSCSDGNMCTGPDICLDGFCTPQGVQECVDPNPCVVTWCDPLFGCQYQAVEVPCDDKNPCTVNDRCAMGFCLGAAVYCDDGNPCTVDFCDPTTGSCAYVQAQGACNDGNPCTVKDTCHQGVCLGEPRDCDDGKPCTSDACVIPTGCVYTNLSGLCDDGSACTQGDTCVADLCVGTPISCEDDNPCTDDSCSPVAGCQFLPNSLPCFDGNYCTSNDRCSAGLCVGNEVDCDDSNPCTQNDCHPFAGCILWHIDVPCSDNNACTVGDWCINGQCIAGAATVCEDNNQCTADACDPVTGLCTFYTLSTPCDDGTLCTSNDICIDGQCVGDPLDCNDNNPCTSDSCSPAFGCSNQPLDGSWCTDGNACTEPDRCFAGKCMAGPNLDCDDGDPCTLDYCEPALGCVHEFSATPQCLYCGPLVTIDGESEPDPEQLFVVAGNLCSTSYTLLPAPTPSLDFDASLAAGCMPGEIPFNIYIPIPLPEFDYTLKLGFQWSASLCPTDEGLIASVALLSDSGVESIFVPVISRTQEPCGYHDRIAPQDSFVELEVVFSSQTESYRVWRDGQPLDAEPRPLDPDALPEFVRFVVRSGGAEAPVAASIKWFQVEAVCP